MVKTKTQTVSSRDQRQEARSTTVAKALIKARGDSVQAAMELLEKERKKMLIKQEALDAAFVKELVAKEQKIKAEAQADATEMHLKNEEEAKDESEKKNEKASKAKVRNGNPTGGGDDDDPDDSTDEDSPVIKKTNTPMKRKDKHSDSEDDSEDSVDIKTPPKRKRDKKRNKKKKKYESSDSESDGSPVAFARNPNTQTRFARASLTTRRKRTTRFMKRRRNLSMPIPPTDMISM
jgi:hypothetical protein